MDIVAKKAKPDKDGVRIAELDEMSFREILWTHRPLTDFWRIGGGTAARLEAMQLFTLGDVARASLDLVFEALLYSSCKALSMRIVIVTDLSSLGVMINFSIIRNLHYF